MNQRPTYQQIGADAGRKARLAQFMYQHGPGNGTMMVLPIDQGLEHGPIDFLGNADSAHPKYQFELALQGGFSAIATHIGLAEKYYPEYAGKVPLILKLNGKTCIPPDNDAFSACTGTVEDAIRLGASAVGYTLFVGSSRQDEDFTQFAKIRKEAHEKGMPVIVWAYPRGEFIEKKGGTKTLYAVSYAARVAHELGADVIKVNFPEGVNQYCPAPYKDMKISFEEQLHEVIRYAGHSYLIFSGGSLESEEQMIHKLHLGMQQGGSGSIFGRNVWQRPFDEAIIFAGKIKEVLKQYNHDAY